MSWLVYILLSVILYSISVIIQRIILKDDKSDPIAFSIFTGIVISALLFGYGLVAGGMRVPPLLPLLFPLIAMTVLYGLGTMFMYSGLKFTTASNFTILFSSRALFTIIASTLALHEGLSPKQFVGFALIFGSIVLASLHEGKFHMQKGEWYVLAAAVCFGLANTNDRALLQHVEINTYLVAAFLIPAIFVAALQPKSIMRMRSFFERTMFIKSFLLCALYSVAALTFFYAIKLTPNSSQVAAINITSVLVIVLLSVTFLGERDHLVKRIVAACVNIGGLLLLTL